MGGVGLCSQRCLYLWRNPREDGTVKIYWGGADSVMCMGTAVIDDLVDLCLKVPRPPD